MTGGTALPADISPHPAPNTPDEPGNAGGGEGTTGAGEGEAGVTGAGDGGSGGRPKPFFAEQPEQFEVDQQAGSPDSQPPAQPPGSHRPGQLGQGPPYGQPGLGPIYGRPGDQAPGGLDQRGQRDQQTGWPSAQSAQRQRPQRSQRSQRPQRPTEPPGRELRQRAIASLVFGVVSLLALLGLGTDLRKGVYLLAFSMAVGLAACVIGITALIKARRTGTYRPRGAVGGIVLGALATVISLPILVTYLVFPTQVNNYVNCLSQAQNSSQQQACMTKFYRSIHIGSSALGGGFLAQPRAGADTGADAGADAGPGA